MQLLEDAASQSQGIGLLPHLGHHHELISGDAAHQIPFPHKGAQALTHLTQHFIAGGMAVQIVDLFEAIEIYEQHCRMATGRRKRGEPFRQVSQQQPPIGQAGQVIAGGLTNGLFLGNLFGPQGLLFGLHRR